MAERGRTIEMDRVALFEAWGFFRERLRQQRGGRLRGVQQSLLPMLTELLPPRRLGRTPGAPGLEVTAGFLTSELSASVKFGRATVSVGAKGGEQLQIAGKENG